MTGLPPSGPAPPGWGSTARVGPDNRDCPHPADAIMWNPWNLVTQCHRCGHVMDRTPMPSNDAMRWEPGDLLTEDDKRTLAEDLRRIHNTVRPGWLGS